MNQFPCGVICLVTDRRRLAPQARTTADELRALDAQVDDALGAGIDVVQVRERDLSMHALIAFVSALAARRPLSTQILVNDRADVALAAGADGVHLPGQGLATGRVREWQPRWTIGRSVHVAGDLASVGPADYVIAGTTFQTVSKPDEAPIAGLEGLARVVLASRMPVLAIGGITPHRVGPVMRAGAAGVAAIGVFLPVGRAPEARGAAQAVRELRVAMASR